MSRGPDRFVEELNRVDLQIAFVEADIALSTSEHWKRYRQTLVNVRLQEVESLVSVEAEDLRYKQGSIARLNSIVALFNTSEKGLDALKAQRDQLLEVREGLQSAVLSLQDADLLPKQPEPRP